MSAIVTPFASVAGERLLRSTDAGLVNWRAIESAVPQDNTCYCGPAALYSALDSAHDRSAKGRITSQDALLDDKAGTICSRDQVLGRVPRTWSDGREERRVTYAGMSIEEATRILGLYFSDAFLTYARPDSRAAFEAWLQRCGSAPSIFNFLGADLGLPLGGHFASVGAYNRQSRHALVLDPARHRVGWYWAPLDALFNAMGTLRPGLQRARGWIQVEV